MGTCVGGWEGEAGAQVAVGAGWRSMDTTTGSRHRWQARRHGACMCPLDAGSKACYACTRLGAQVHMHAQACMHPLNKHANTKFQI